MSRFGKIVLGQISAALFAFVTLGGFPGVGVYMPDAAAALRSPAQTIHLDDNWRIYCAGRTASTKAAAGLNASDPAVFLALRLRVNEVTSQENAYCLTDHLTVKFVTDIIEERVLRKSRSINFSLPVKIDGRYKNIGFSFSTDDSDSRDQKRRLDDVLNDCDVDGTPDKFGLFRIYGNDSTCKTYPSRTAKSSIMTKLYGMTSPGDIVQMTCYDACIMSINFNNRIVKLIFHKKRISKWQEIQSKALAVLRNRVVLNYETGRCRGDLCDALMLELN